MYLLIVGSHSCVMRFVYALHMCQQNLVLFLCLHIELIELVIEVIFNYCTTPPCHKINRFKRPFRGSRFERLDDAFVLLVSLIFLYPQKIASSASMMLLCCSLASSSFTLRKSSFLSYDHLNSRMYSVRFFLLITMPSGLQFHKRFS